MPAAVSAAAIAANTAISTAANRGRLSESDKRENRRLGRVRHRPGIGFSPNRDPGIGGRICSIAQYTAGQGDRSRAFILLSATTPTTVNRGK